ncbi:MAG: mechanosensitive ion channel family protein [Pirellulales bacterium]
MTAVSLLVGMVLFVAASAAAQGPQTAAPPAESDAEPAPSAPDQVDVEPVAADEQISTRLTRILDATEWFEDPRVAVDEGVVFLSGRTDAKQHQEWAAQLAANTQDVVAVVNRIEVTVPSMWDLSPAWTALHELGAETVQNSPLIAVGLFLLVAAWLAARWSVRAVDLLFRRRIKSQLLRNVTARAAAVPVFLFGLYIVLKVSGLTRLAVTVLGGTGLVGLVLGFAFRDIAENFLASILISMQNPFARGDVIDVAGHTGFVRSVNTRSTLLMTLEGNHVQIPNATIYKETITNFTANPYTRIDFTVGIGYEDSVTRAQSVAEAVLREHQAVVGEPEPMVLVEELGAATVSLRIYFWVDIVNYSLLKVRSSVIRMIKAEFERAGISMPDEAREVVFPHGVPVHMMSENDAVTARHDRETSDAKKRGGGAEESLPIHSADEDLESEAGEIEQQARASRSPESGEDLLES